jgi:hypothetical protein
MTSKAQEPPTYQTHLPAFVEDCNQSGDKERADTADVLSQTSVVLD